MNNMTSAAASGAETNAGNAEWRILLADDHAMVREALAQMLEHLDPNLRIQQARNVDEAKELLQADNDFSMVLLDYNMPGMSGASTITALKCTYPSLPIGVISGYVSSDEVEPLIAAGAVGVFPKAMSAPALLMALKLARSGQVFVPWSGDLARPAEPPEPGQSAVPLPPISDRQKEVLVRVVAGAPNKEIARQLGLSEVTIKIHVASLCRKFGVANRTQLATAAMRAGVKPTTD
jgi:two-component system, NarL family, nitrate/nitrite response regulator NarL